MRTHQTHINKIYMQTAQSFTNFTKEDFVCNWDGKPWKFKAKETMLLQTHLAVHFAKHLIIRDLNEDDISTNNKIEIAKRIKLCLGDDLIEAESPEKLASKIINEEDKGSDSVENLDQVDIMDMTRKQLNAYAAENGIEDPESFKNVKELRAALTPEKSDEDDSDEGDDSKDTADDDKDDEFADADEDEDDKDKK